MDKIKHEYEQYWQIIVPHVENLIPLIAQDNQVDRFTEPQKVLWLVFVLSAEVKNGGFTQYFMNASGDHANETMNALLAIGAPYHAAILSRALAAWPDQRVPTHTQEREKLFFQIEQAADSIWDNCTKELYKSEENLGSLLLKYIRKRTVK